uniref:PHD finger protein At2g01810 n=1 Tax=Anthurium amnicola TaxID=1678845 RepID=A0A1D1XGU7_9ARAE
MKGRSSRLPVPSAPSEDWGDGSWTVDCPCGVTFDDGEEMVDCDVCGVWVHTRCSRFVKGEASFACDKCKGRKPRLFSSSSSAAPTTAAADNKGNHHDGNGSGSGSGAGASNTEETEVAQLLVELPTKTDPCPPLGPPQRPPAVRLWTRAPIEERVHVQGVPGGDPTLFQGLSSVFTSELWKCAGYVPKKFNFKYKEFPCWDDEEESENPANRGADLLFSLSKEITPCGPVEGYGRRPSSKTPMRGDGKGLESGGGGSGRLQASVKKERNKIRSVGVSGKRKEEFAGGKDQSGKKKSKSGEKAVPDNRKRGSSPIVNACKSSTYEDNVSHFEKLDFECVNIGDRKNDMPLETRFSDHHEAAEYDSKPKHVLAVKSSSGVLSDEPLQHSLVVEVHGKVEACDERDGSRTQSKVRISTASPSETSGHVKEEDFNALLNVLRQVNKESNDSGGLHEDYSSVSVKSEKSKPRHGDFRCTSSDVQYVPTLQISNTEVPPNSVKVKIEAEPLSQDGQGSGSSALPLAPVADEMLLGTELTTEYSERSVVRSREDLQINDTAKVSPSCKDRSLDAESEPKIRHINQEKNLDSIASCDIELKKNEQEIKSSGPPTAEEGSSESVHYLKYDATAKSRSINSNSLVSIEIKLEPTVENSSFPVFSKSSVLGIHKSPGSAASSTAEKVVTKQRVKLNTHVTGKRENSTVSICTEERVKENTRHSTKRPLTDPTSSVSKSSQACKISHSTSKHIITDPKEHLHCPSKVISRSEKMVNLSSTGEATGSQQSQSASIQMKLTASGSCQKSENMKQLISQPSAKVNHSMAVPPPTINASAQLSDEELALLLHQELNSSPRVPRVPRIRQAGGLQLTSGAATSILSRRSSSSGGKDQPLASRRKNKDDASRDSSRIEETKKLDRFSSPDAKKEDATFPADASTKDGYGKSFDALSSTKKSIQLCSIAGANNGSSSSIMAEGENALSVRNSPQNVSGDDAASQALTLPGLIDDIMSKGKCVTYDQLCREVLPHWRNLRKPNGERYAYSSHLQAVLDCLRNRNEWAYLIDRGPKQEETEICRG